MPKTLAEINDILGTETAADLTLIIADVKAAVRASDAGVIADLEAKLADATKAGADALAAAQATATEAAATAKAASDAAAATAAAALADAQAVANAAVSDLAALEARSKGLASRARTEFTALAGAMSNLKAISDEANLKFDEAEAAAKLKAIADAEAMVAKLKA